MPPLDIIAHAINPGSPPTLGTHRFSLNKNGDLEHYIDGDLRATIPAPENDEKRKAEGSALEDYARAWPQCADLVAQRLRR